MGITASTFDANNKGSSVTLSGGNLTATVSSGTGSVRGTNRLSGLAYFEMTVGATLSGSARIGCCNQGFVFTGLLGVDNNGAGYDSGGTVKINNATVATIATFTTNSRIGVAIDFAKQLIWFRVNNGNWNNDVIGNQNPVGDVGGISISALGGTLSPAWGGSATSSVTAAFASGSWVDTAPTGYASVDTLAAAGDNGAVAGASAAFTQYGAAKSSTVPTPTEVSSYQASRGSTVKGAWYGNGTKQWSPAATATNISGVVEENGVPVAGKKVALYDAATNSLLGTAISDGGGNWNIPALGRTNVYAVALDPTYQALVYDQLTPI